MAIEARRIEVKEVKVDDKGGIAISGLPFSPGETVEVILISRGSQGNGQQRFPLRGKPIRYDDPTAPIAGEDWEALK